MEDQSSRPTTGGAVMTSWCMVEGLSKREEETCWGEDGVNCY